MKTVLFAAVALSMLSFTAGVRAEDDLLSEVANLKASSISDADNAIQDNALAGVDVDGLASKAGSEKSDKAIEACFRNFGWGGGCYNYGYYNYGCYNYGCYNYYRPYYSCYPTYYSCYRPMVSYVSYPVYSYYWGCY